MRAWFPEYRALGYTRQEAEQVVCTAERLWHRYTARGLTVDSPHPTAKALEPFEVLVQAMWHFGVRRLSREPRVRFEKSSRQDRTRH